MEVESGGGGSGRKGQLGRVIAKTVMEREAIKRNNHNHFSLSFLCFCVPVNVNQEEEEGSGKWIRESSVCRQ